MKLLPDKLEEREHQRVSDLASDIAAKFQLQLLEELASSEDSDGLYWISSLHPDKPEPISSAAQLQVHLSTLTHKSYGHLRKRESEIWTQVVCIKSSDHSGLLVETYDGVEAFVKRLYKGTSYPERNPETEKSVLFPCELLTNSEAAEAMIGWMQKSLPSQYQRTDQHFYKFGYSFITYEGD